MNKKFSINRILKLTIISIMAFLYISIVVAMSFGALSAGILTMIPAEASKPNKLGYYSVCAFAPYSTLILLGLSVIGFILFVKMVSFLKRKFRNSKISLEIRKLTN